MGLDAYEKLHQDIYREVYSKLERKESEALRFAPVGTAEQVLNTESLRRFYDSLLEPGHFTLDISKEDFVARIKERELPRFFAVVIISGCSITAARTAVLKLVASETTKAAGSRDLSICTLPVSPHNLDTLFNQDPIAADKFSGKQAYFCPVIFRNKHEQVEDIEHRRLPYLEEHSIGKGSFGRVFKVKIAKGHFPGLGEQTGDGEPLEVARKDYELSSDASIEREIMEKILSRSSGSGFCPNILKTLGSLEFGRNVYSLFMPLALCDLWEYMTENHEARPNSIEERKDLIRCAMGLAEGLRFLHEGMGDDLACYHMDLKPANILIFRERPTDREPFCNIWKLSDFGMSRIKIRTREKDVNRWFVRRSQPDRGSASGTRNARGEGTYLAPESVARGRNMKAESDVWSLGCVLSVLLCYMGSGGKGVGQYAAERRNHADAVQYDTFFLPSRGALPARINPVVTRTHTQLIQAANNWNHLEGEIFFRVLRCVENNTFKVDQSKRCSANDVKEVLSAAFVDLVRNGSPNLLTVTRTDPCDTDVDFWCLSDVEAAKGCQISPDSSLVAYWTDREISLYSVDSLSFAVGNVRQSQQKYTLESQSFYWRSIRLTEKYLVASTTEPTFHCYIFDLGERNLTNPYEVEQPWPAISKLAISPDSGTFLCILKASDTAGKPSSLFAVPILRLIRIAKQLRSADGDLSQQSSASHLHNPASTGWDYPLSWAAEDITRLCFHNERHIYFVVLPPLMPMGGENQVQVVHVDLREKDVHILKVESQGLDSTARLLTTFSPFSHASTTCAVVIHERQLYIHDMRGEGHTTTIRKDIKGYRLRKVIVSANDAKLFLLARKTANHRMVLLEMKIPHLRPRELGFLPHLSEDDHLTLMLYEANGEECVIIAALAGKGQPGIYKFGVNSRRMRMLLENVIGVGIENHDS
ncbi:kinase-like domain-containing protein [Aspergillus pseudodeflectus]|uniref:Kinase-like domain-containing protein n=1 Tax=Aspergillus pseudodeflectus TaxID=176178 RepID=A0ABR4KDU5_9EURO